MSKHTEYGVARGEKIVGDTFPTVDQAKQHHAYVSDQMRSIGIDPDVRLVTVDVTITRGRPKAYKDSADTDTEDTDTEQQTTTD